MGRFVRPLVVLMYYVNYRAFGLAPWTYHVSTLLPHLLSAWLVYLVARRLSEPAETLWAFLAGLLFLAFAGHSEAVAWPAGIADPILTACLMLAFLCYLRGLEAGASPLWLAGMFAAVAASTLAKESWVVFPGLLLAHIVAFDVMGDPSARRRAVIAVLGTSALVAAYLVVRHLVFGSVTGGYAGLGSSLRPGIFATQALAFLFRSFFPATPHLGNPVVRTLAAFLFAAGLLLLGRSARSRAARVLVFAAAALAVALAPVLPLTISIVTTESERYVYLPTAFSCIFLVTAIRTVLTRRTMAVLACALVIGVHAAALVRANAHWRVSGELTRRLIDSYADASLTLDPQNIATTFVLNLPDDVAGAYVFRNGFLPAVQLVRPDVASRTGRTFVVATQFLRAPGDEAHVTSAGDRRFRIDLGDNVFLQAEVPSNALYRVGPQAPGSYDVQFEPSVRTGLILYLTGGRLEAAGTVDGPGLPFGQVDVPSDDARCENGVIRFIGWALDDERIARVVLQDVEPDASHPALLGQAQWAAAGARPDVAATFGGFPGAERAAWSAQLSCARAANNPTGLMRVRVTAYDEGGREAIIGERVVHSLP